MFQRNFFFILTIFSNVIFADLMKIPIDRRWLCVLSFIIFLYPHRPSTPVCEKERVSHLPIPFSQYVGYDLMYRQHLQ